MSPHTLPDEPVVPVHEDGWAVDAYPRYQAEHAFGLTRPDGTETEFDRVRSFPGGQGWQLFTQDPGAKAIVERDAVPQPIVDALDHLAETTDEVGDDLLALDPGESVDLGTRGDGGPEIRRDENCPDGFAIDKHGDELYRDEIERLAELAGLEVSD